MNDGPASSFPHRFAAPAFGAILSGVLTYCLHQYGGTTAVQGRLIRARTTYATEGVVAEPVRFEIELAANMAQAAPTEPAVRSPREVPWTAAAAPRAERNASEAMSDVPVVRPIDLRFAREPRPSRAAKSSTARPKAIGSRERSGPRRPPGTRR